MTVRDTLTCTVETLAYGGDGIARAAGCVVFIPGTVPGETVRVTITQVKKNFARAAVRDVPTPSPLRITPCCRVSDPDTGKACRVPGCVYDHLDYAAELQAKQHQLEGFIRRLPDCAETPFLPPFASPQPLHYRNKMVLHAAGHSGTMRLGYRLEPSHGVLDISACPLACGPINEALAAFRRSGAFKKTRTPCDITFRHTPRDGTLVWRDDEKPEPACDTLLTEASPAGPLRVPYNGFYQVNPAVGEALVRTVADWFSEAPATPDILDLYCGVGVFGFACMKAGAARLTGIESGRAAVSAARQNASALGLPATFHCHALGQERVDLSGLVTEPEHTACIVDPPRDGLAPDIAQALAASGLSRIFYVSCDPATLARDLKTLLAGGYRITRSRLFDMFPRTAHFETLAELQRG